MECRRSGSGFLGRGEFMKTRHRHRVGSQLFPYFPVTAFRRVTPCFMYMWDCHCDICKHSRANVLDRRVENQNNLQRLAKGHVLKWCMGVHMWRPWEGMAALLRNSHLQILLHVVPQTKLSLENQGELKAPGPRVVQIHSLQWTPPVPFLNIILEPIKHASFP